MALVQCDFFSEVLEGGASVTVLLPEPSTGQIGLAGSPGDGPPPVLYLLHGMSDDHTTWVRRTSLERYVAPLGLAVVMPAAGRSFYADEAHGHRYWTYLTEELPAAVGRFFRLSDDPARTFVAGLSMGGYGALKWALHHPDRFAAVASMSGALDLPGLLGRPDLGPELRDRVFPHGAGAGDDLFALLAAADAERLPPLHLSCGTEDELYPASRDFAAAAVASGWAPVTTDFRPGEHEWGFWDEEVRRILAWLPGRG